MTIPQRVYHFTQGGTALRHILPNRTLRIGSLGETNDPRETKEWGVLYEGMPVALADQLTLERVAEIQTTANRLRTKEWWALCTTVDDPDLKEPGPNQVDLT